MFATPIHVSDQSVLASCVPSPDPRIAWNRLKTAMQNGFSW
jgi:hypothetical protein